MKKENKLVGFKFADGVHWEYENNEIAIINESRHEIEWLKRPSLLPEDVVEAVRAKIPVPKGKWLIEARPNRVSTTQGYIDLYINNEYIESFADDVKLDSSHGTYESSFSDEQLGKMIYKCFWPHNKSFSSTRDKCRSVFYPKWRGENRGAIEENRYEIFYNVQDEFLAEDASEQLHDYFDEMSDEDILIKMGENDWNSLCIYLADRFNEAQDCNISINTTWHDIIAQEVKDTLDSAKKGDR